MILWRWRQMSRKEEREKVLVPVRRRAAETKRKLPADPADPAPPPEDSRPKEMPRRWRVY
jgi:hypothetical protein